ncbi:MAG: YigZ family protein [Candidatus Aminicenantes bacterium]|nr:YigZ family protein [Candidatus Aminicenantes bacterium]
MTPIAQSYLTVDRDWGPVEIKEKGSRFIAYLFPASDRDAAGERIVALRESHHDATHVCFAWRLGEGGETEHRYNDDGEPGGTAGLPIYNEIRRKHYLNVIVAVVRYYGGVKLGTGGLARAYGQAARAVMQTSRPVRVILTDPVEVAFPFDLTGEVMHVVRRLGLDITGQEHTPTGTRLTVRVPRGGIDALQAVLMEAGGGKVTLSPALSEK